MSVQDELKELPLSGMPFLLTHMLSTLGVTAVYEILNAYGGRVKYIAKHPERCFLIQYAPIDHVAAFCLVFGGESIEIPKVDHLERRLRNKKILVELHDGGSVSDIAHRYCLSMRQVRNIRNNHGDN